MRGKVVAGIDVGGTFTDLILIDGREGGGVSIAKTPTTTDNQAYGVVAALGATKFPVADIDLIVHGTTTTTNAVLERRLAKTGMITTQGFRDIIELGRRTRPQAYGMTGTFVPVIPRNLRLEVPERVEASGKVRLPLDEDAMRAAVKQLLDAGCESLVIHFLHAYANPAHEQRAAEIAAETWPNDYITTGHSLLSEAREFERGVTAAVNASVQPILERYVNRLRGELEGLGYARDFLIMNGNGGMISARFVTRESAKTVMSGPASGVIAAAYTGKRAGFENLVTYDMGGTSTDVALIRNAEPAVSSETEIEYAMPIHVPMVAVHTVGAGGGSIARVDASGLIQVGPESAGASPGPICYGRGGNEPTITDANLLLGRLDPKRLLAVDSPVTVEHVRAIFEEKIGKAAGLDAIAAAGAVLRLGNIKMAGAIRMVSVGRGHDPRDFALFAFGGAGPLHASALARELGLPTVLVPARPGITNALGCVVADLRHDFVNTVNQPVALLDEARSARRAGASSRGGRGADRQGGGDAGDDPHHPFGRHAVRRPDAYIECRTAVGRCRPCDVAEPFRKGLFRPLQGRTAGDPRQSRQPQHLGDRRARRRRPVAADRSRRQGGDARRGAARDTAGLVRWRMARHAGLCARKTAARRRHCRPGDPRADGRDDRAGARRPGALRCGRQHHRGGGEMSLDADIPLPLVGRGQGWGYALGQVRQRRSLEGVPGNTPTLYPSPQGGGRSGRRTCRSGQGVAFCSLEVRP